MMSFPIVRSSFPPSSPFFLLFLLLFFLALRNGVGKEEYRLTPTFLRIAACEDGNPSMVQSASLNLSGGHSQYISNVHLEPWVDEDDFHERLYEKYREGLLGSAKGFLEKMREREGAGGREEEEGRTMVFVSAGASSFLLYCFHFSESHWKEEGLRRSADEQINRLRRVHPRIGRNVPTSPERADIVLSPLRIGRVRIREDLCGRETRGRFGGGLFG